MLTRQSVVANQRREPRASAGRRWGWGPSANKRKLTKQSVVANQWRGPVVAVLLLTFACTAKEVPYVDSINEWRTTKDAFMQRSPDSPIPPDRRASFPPLTYFPIEPDTACRRRSRSPARHDVIEIPTSAWRTPSAQSRRSALVHAEGAAARR